MLAAHDAFLLAWGHGEVLSREQLRAAAAGEADDAGLAAWVEQQLEATDAGRAAREFDPAYGDAVAADQGVSPRSATRWPNWTRQPIPSSPRWWSCWRARPRRRSRCSRRSAPRSATSTSTSRRAWARRERVTVIGSESTPDQRLAALGRFAPRTVVRPDYEPPDGEVDLLLSTDVLSEGQNLQQAQEVISYDMPWNPQRVVQRNGRVIRLLSDHAEVYLWTMLPKQGELERLLGLEARIQAKVKAASGVYGMEAEVIEGLDDTATPLRRAARRR